MSDGRVENLMMAVVEFCIFHVLLGALMAFEMSHKYISSK